MDPVMMFLGKIGKKVLARWATVRRTAGIICGVVCLAVQPGRWPRTVRAVMWRQILFTGVEASGLTCLIAFLAGVSIVTQAQVWSSNLGQSAMLGPVLIAVLMREVGPLLVNFVVIGRSGTAMAAELATMTVRNEVDILDAQGVDPMTYLVMPRILAMALSVFSLSVFFVAVSLGTGYLLGVLLGIMPGDASLFATSVLGAIQPRDVANLIAKTVLPALCTGAICCVEGLTIRRAATEIPQAVTRSVVRSISIMLLISAVVSVLTYV
jgi:phospholipid/cholesterol/gamma-HCH transport system permease protein